MKSRLYDPASVSIIIPAHQDGPMLRMCLDSVALLDPAPGEVIIAVDGADSHVIEVSNSFGFSVIPLKDGPGVSASRNAGASQAKGSLLAFLDSDVRPQSNFVKRLLEVMEQNPHASAAFGSYDDQPAAKGLISRYRNLLHHYTHQISHRETQTFWAGCGTCTAHAFREVGGYDERFRKPSVEDIELGYRLRKNEYCIVIEPSWQVQHLKQWRFTDLFWTDLMQRAFPWSLLLLKRGEFDNTLNTDRRSRFSAMLCIFVLLGGLCSIRFPIVLPFTIIALAFVIFLNRRFYYFLGRSSGWCFATLAIPLHLLYFVVASVGFLFAYLIYQQEMISVYFRGK